MKTYWKQSVAVVLSASLVWTTGNFAQALPVPAGPVNLAPPTRLGYLLDSFNVHQVPQVILIQDLHANYGVQKNIAGILEFLSKRLPAPVLPHAPSVPFTLAVEGASGPIDSSVMALFPDQKIKQTAADYLMKEGELTGAEYFAIMRSVPNLLTGVEDSRYYNLHRDLFRQTLEKRTRLVEILHGIQADLTTLHRTVYSKELRRIQHKLEKGQISEEEAYQLKLAAASPSGSHAPTASERDLVQVEHDLGILLKVADLQATEAEVRTFGPRLNQFIALIRSLLESNGIHSIDESSIRELISSSIDYYALALARNKPMVENTLALINADSHNNGFAKQPIRKTSDSQTSGNPPLVNLPLANPPSANPKVAVLVAGGFHTRPITQLLRARNISYAVITPKVDESSDADQALYVKRLSGQFLTDDEIIATAITHQISPQAWLDRLKNTLSPDAERTMREGGNSAGEGSKKVLAVGRFGLEIAPSFLLFASGYWLHLHHMNWAAWSSFVAGTLWAAYKAYPKAQKLVQQTNEKYQSPERWGFGQQLPSYKQFKEVQHIVGRWSPWFQSGDPYLRQALMKGDWKGAAQREFTGHHKNAEYHLLQERLEAVSSHYVSSIKPNARIYLSISPRAMKFLGIINDGFAIPWGDLTLQELLRAVAGDNSTELKVTMNSVPTVPVSDPIWIAEEATITLDREDGAINRLPVSKMALPVAPTPAAGQPRKDRRNQRGFTFTDKATALLGGFVAAIGGGVLVWGTATAFGIVMLTLGLIVLVGMGAVWYFDSFADQNQTPLDPLTEWPSHQEERSASLQSLQSESSTARRSGLPAPTWEDVQEVIYSLMKLDSLTSGTSLKFSQAELLEKGFVFVGFGDKEKPANLEALNTLAITLVQDPERAKGYELHGDIDGSRIVVGKRLAPTDWLGSERRRPDARRGTISGQPPAAGAAEDIFPPVTSPNVKNIPYAGVGKPRISGGFSQQSPATGQPGNSPVVARNLEIPQGQRIFDSDEEMYREMSRFKAIVLFLGHGSKSQFQDVEAVLKEVDSLVGEYNTFYGKGQWVAVFGGDGFNKEKPDIAHILKYLNESHGVPILAIQSDIVEKKWGGVDKYIDYVRYVPTQMEADGKTVIWGGLRDGKPVGPTAVYLGDRFLSGKNRLLKGVVTLGGGPIALAETQYAYNNGMPITYVRAATKNPEINGKFGSLDEWVTEKTGAASDKNRVTFTTGQPPKSGQNPEHGISRIWAALGILGGFLAVLGVDVLAFSAATTAGNVMLFAGGAILLTTGIISLRERGASNDQPGKRQGEKGETSLHVIFPLASAVLLTIIGGTGVVGIVLAGVHLGIGAVPLLVYPVSGVTLIGGVVLLGLFWRSYQSASGQPGADYTSRSNHAVPMFLAGLVTGLWYFDFKAAGRQLRAGWRLLRETRWLAEQVTDKHISIEGQARLQRELRQFDAKAEVQFESANLGFGQGGRIRTQVAPDGHRIYFITRNANAPEYLWDEIDLHELTHAVRAATGETSALYSRWQTRLGRVLGGWVAWMIEEFVTISAVDQARQKDREILSKVVVPQAAQAMAGALKAPAPDPSSFSISARGLIAKLRNFDSEHEILGVLRQNRRELFGQAVINASA